MKKTKLLAVLSAAMLGCCAMGGTAFAEVAEPVDDSQYQLGDINLDGEVDVEDAQNAVRIFTQMLVHHDIIAKGWYTEEQIAQGLGTQTTTGYKLGTFDEDTEIFFVMTPNGYDKKINSYLPVNDPDNNPPVTSILASRQINTVDLAGNIRVNFGTVDGVAHEFVIGSEATPSTPSGQPLPGVLTSCLVALGATGIAARRRKHSKK